MTLAAAESALRVAAKAWADANSFAFHWDNAAPREVTGRLLSWAFQTEDSGNITDLIVQHQGRIEASLWLPAGEGAALAVQLAESLREEFVGNIYAECEILDESGLTPIGRSGPRFGVMVSLHFEMFERTIPGGPVGAYEDPTAALAFEAVRERWESQVRAPLLLRTFYDNAPPDAAEPPPWAFVSVKLLRPVRLETTSVRVPGRAIAALNHAPGIGVQDANNAASLASAAFHQCTIKGICFGTPSVQRVGRTSADTWQTNIRMPFHFDLRA